MIHERTFGKPQERQVQELIGRFKKGSETTHPLYPFIEKLVKAVLHMTSEEQDKFTELYLKHIVDTEPFADGKIRGITSAAQRLNGLGKPPKDDGIAFWNEIHSAIPGLLTEEDKKWLVENDPRGNCTFTPLFYIAYFGNSREAQELVTAIHAWQ